MVGLSGSDDAAAYKINDETALISTIDFFPPVCDAPYLFGQIAAANALSDMYAMGAVPRLALNLLCVTNGMPHAVIKDILRGGADKIREAGAVICGGHSIYDESPKYGLAVNGFVHPDKILKNSNVQAGDVLILTKPIGSGVITTAAKADLVAPKLLNKVYQTMAFLNAAACGVMLKYPVNACTDITGFGLLGHLYEMAKASGVSAELEYSRVPLFDTVIEHAESGFLPAGVYSNRQFVGSNVRFVDTPRVYQDVLFDPQTAGGLLISVCKEQATALYEELCSVLSHTVCGKPAVIGQAVPQGNDLLTVKS